MSLALNYCKLLGSRVNSVHKFGGYLSRSIVTVEDYKITWKRPEKIAPQDPRKSGDGKLDVFIKPTDFKLYYQNSKELEDASDLVKKMFSIELQNRKDVRNLHREAVINRVKRHMSDRGSIEVKIAAMTSEIHHLQGQIHEQPRNKRMRIFLKELVEKRQKYLKYLRIWDYRKFEWLLEKLNLTYKPQPINSGMVSRKESIRQLTQKYCDNIIQRKFDAYKAELREKQKSFYLEKAETLAYILKTETECGLTPTVTEEDIETARKKAEDLLKEDKKDNK